MRLKKERLGQLEPFDRFSFYLMDLTDREGIESLFAQEKPETVIHLTAQAGVPYSLENPPTPNGAVPIRL